MDTELQAATSTLRLSLMAMQQREKRLKKTVSKLSRHYSRVAHTGAAIALLEQLLGMMLQDPDHWDDEPDVIPF